MAPLDPLTTDSEVTTEEVPGGPAASFSSTAAATWALFVGLLLLMLGNGLGGVVLGVRSEQEGFGLLVSGLIMASYFAGFLAGARYAEHALLAVGHIRVFAALASTASTVVLVHALAVEPITWAALRFVFGGCMAGLYVVVESWLNDLATNATRGRLLSLYMIVSMGGLSGGQLLLNAADPSSFRLFVLASALVSVALVPVTLSATSSPPLTHAEPMDLRRLARLAPIGVTSSFFVGAGAGAVMALGAIYGSSVGLSSSRIATLLAAPMVGGVVFQWPVGSLADRFSRRGVMMGTAAMATSASLVLTMIGDGTTGALAAMFVLGGGIYPLYSLTIAYTNDMLAPSQMLGAGATLVRVNGSGALAGPIVGAVAMAIGGPRSIFWVLVAVHVCVLIVTGSRILSGPDAPDARTNVRPFPIRAGAGAFELLGRRTRRLSTPPPEPFADAHHQ